MAGTYVTADRASGPLRQASPLHTGTGNGENRKRKRTDVRFQEVDSAAIQYVGGFLLHVTYAAAQYFDDCIYIMLIHGNVF